MYDKPPFEPGRKLFNHLPYMFKTYVYNDLKRNLKHYLDQNALYTLREFIETP